MNPLKSILLLYTVGVAVAFIVISSQHSFSCN